MRRLAPLLLFALAATSLAQRPLTDPSEPYLRLRAQRGLVQPVGVAALRATTKPQVVELCGKPNGTCQVGDTAILVLGLQDGSTQQEIEAKALPEWLANTTESVRLIVRCERVGTSVRATLLAAAPEIDVLPVEEAYWRRIADARRAAEAAKAPRGRAPASRGGVPRGTIFGPIGRSHRSAVLPVSRVSPIYAAFIQGQNPRLSADKAIGIANDIIRYSVGYGVDARLVLAILMVESGFDPNAVSHSGAVGLGQLMPSTARWMGVRNSYDTTENLYGMIKLLNTHSRGFNRTPDDPLVLAAYNAGEGAVRRHGGVPPFRETQAYVRRVTSYYHGLRGY